MKNYPEYGCHCDLEPGMEPDDCVLNVDNYRPFDCVYARTALKEGKGRNDCEFWAVVQMPNKRIERDKPL